MPYSQILDSKQAIKEVARTKFVGERSVSQRARTRAAAQEAARAEVERELTPFNEVSFDSRQSYERLKVIFGRQILNERIIHFNSRREDFMRKRIDELGWSYMYNDLVDINITWVKEFYSHFLMADQKTIYLRGEQIPIDVNSISSFLGIQNVITDDGDAYKRNVTRWKAGNLDMDMVLATIAEPGMQWNSYNPGSRRADNGILNRNARGWFKMMVSNLKPLKHETTFSMETAMLIYTLMDQGDIHLGRILNKSMYDAAQGAKDRRLASPVMITRMATAHNIPRYEDDDIYTKQAKKKARKANPQRPIPPPIPPLIHEQPSSSVAAAQPPPANASCTDIFRKILRRLRRRKQDHRNTQYMIRTAFPELSFPDVRPVSTSDLDDADYS
ncbi:hypothetical protein PIB30_028653 [Stylosanthes scabra]|uniref:Putative plant transposon protein domain-containing protein n=1 Tax=Stylosanthes scabra TaxID=79078 RepID=A0ABU6QCF1_9FABA|nr:hypothetical protein [Stylosanthes scabra]